MADDVLRLRATVVSEEALANIRAIGREIGLVQTRGGAGARQAASAWAQLGLTIKNVGRELATINPMFAGFGAAGAGLGAGLLVKRIADMAQQMVNLRHASRELGMSERDIRAWSKAAELAGVSAQTMQQNLRNFTEITHGLRYNVGGVRDELIRMGAGPVVARIQAARDQAERLRIAFQFKDTLMREDPSGFKARVWFDRIGLGAESARLSLQDYNREREKIKPPTPEEIERAKQFAEAWSDFSETLKTMGQRAAIRLFPAIQNEVRDIEKILDLIGKIDKFLGGSGEGGGDLMGRFSTWLLRKMGIVAPAPGGTGVAPASPAEEQRQGGPRPLGRRRTSPASVTPQPGDPSYMPISFGGFQNTGGFSSSHGFTVMRPGGTGTASAEDQSAIRIVRTGVFEALVEFQSYLDAQIGGTGGVRNASLGGRGGVGMGGGAGGGPGGGGPGAGSGSGPGTRSNTSTNDTTPATGPLHGGPVSGVTQVGRDAQGNLVAPPLSIQGIQDALAGKAPVGVTQVPPGGLPGMSLEGIGAAVRGEAQPAPAAGGRMPSHHGGPGPGAPGTSAGGPAGITAPAGARVVTSGLATVTSRSGRTFRVDERFAANFQGFINDYEAAGGVIGPHSGTLGARPNNPSGHPIGTAVDINQVARNVRRGGVSLPPDVERRLAERWGLVSGGDWRNPDAGHFGVRSVQAAREALIRNGVDPATAARLIPQGSVGPQGAMPQGYRPFLGKGAPRGAVIGGATIPPGTSPEAVAALNDVAAKRGIDPAAIAAMIKTESNWNTNTVSPSGRYRGLTQVGPEMGNIGRTAAEQIYTYGRWLDRYKVMDKLKQHGVNLADHPPHVQAAILQGFQFSPNRLGWLKAFARGDTSVRTTGTRQARVLGDTSIGAMSQYYQGVFAGNPVVRTGSGGVPYVTPSGMPSPEVTPPPPTARIDAAVSGSNVTGRVAVTVNSNGTKADTSVQNEGKLFQESEVKQHRQMQPTEAVTSTWAGAP